MSVLLKGGRLATTELVEWRGRSAVRKTLRMRPRIPLLSREVDRFLAAPFKKIDLIPQTMGSFEKMMTGLPQ